MSIECGNETDCPGNAQTDTYGPELRDAVIHQWNSRSTRGEA